MNFELGLGQDGKFLKMCFHYWQKSRRQQGKCFAYSLHVLTENPPPSQISFLPAATLRARPRPPTPASQNNFGKRERFSKKCVTCGISTQQWPSTHITLIERPWPSTHITLIERPCQRVWLDAETTRFNKKRLHSYALKLPFWRNSAKDTCTPVWAHRNHDDKEYPV